MTFLRWVFLSALLVPFLFPLSSLAGNEVTLRSANGKITLKGTLLGYDGATWRLRTRFGDMTLDALGTTCRGAACPDPARYAADLGLAGDSVMLKDLLDRLVRSFAQERGLRIARIDNDGSGWSDFISNSDDVPLARMQFMPGKLSSAVSALKKGRVQFIAANLRPGEQLPPFAGLRSQVVGLDAIIPIVSPENPVQAISLDQIRRIWTGEITNWADLGGYDAPITVYLPRPDSDLARAFQSDVLDKARLNDSVERRRFDKLSDLAQAVSKDAFGIGYVGFAAIGKARPLALRGDCGILQYPTRFAVQSGDYPLARTLSLFTPDRPLAPFARAFLAWLRGPGAWPQIDRAGYIAPAPDQLPLSRQEGRLANAISSIPDTQVNAPLKELVATFSGASRLALTARFSAGTTRLDAWSRQAVARLSRMVEEGDFDGRELIFAGFSDSQGSAKGNRTLSRQRAEAVLGMLRSLARRADLGLLRFRAVGLGAISPLACDDTPSGKRLNRRVEIWVR